jgi:hypothetical protein
MYSPRGLRHIKKTATIGMDHIVACFLGNATVTRGRWFDTSFYWTFHLAELQLFTVQIYSTETRDLSSGS